MPTILIVDDAIFVRAQYAEILRRHGYEVVEAEHGLEALDKYREVKPDAVIMDIGMPIMGGISALQEIIHLYPDAKVTMMTGAERLDLVEECLRAGARDVLFKPITSERLLDAVRSMVG